MTIWSILNAVTPMFCCTLLFFPLHLLVISCFLSHWCGLQNRSRGPFLYLAITDYFIGPKLMIDVLTMSKTMNYLSTVCTVQSEFLQKSTENININLKIKVMVTKQMFL